MSPGTPPLANRTGRRNRGGNMAQKKDKRPRKAPGGEALRQAREARAAGNREDALVRLPFLSVLPKQGFPTDQRCHQRNRTLIEDPLGRSSVSIPRAKIGGPAVICALPPIPCASSKQDCSQNHTTQNNTHNARHGTHGHLKYFKRQIDDPEDSCTADSALHCVI